MHVKFSPIHQIFRKLAYMIFYIKTVEEFGLHKELGKVTQGEGIRVGKMTKVCKILEWRGGVMIKRY